LETGRGSEGILSEELAGKREEIIELLKTAYFAELETVINYVTNSTNPDGVRAQASSGKNVAEVFRAAARAANEGAEATVPLTARRGRASYLGARAEGHMDPGAHSTYLLLAAAARSLEA
jgi:hypothetical protein